jgi:uncharacterized protein YbjT (DUF2867 family)
MRVTVLGGRGLLGSHLCPLLDEAGHDVSITSRSAGDGLIPANIETGEGLAEAVHDADVVVHLASDPRKPRRVDIAGTARLLETLSGAQHLFYMSIVGVDQHPFGYYQAKFEAERMIESSGMPNTILRATQFHDFVAYFLAAACKPPVALVPKRFVFQPVATTEVAQQLAALVHDPRPGLQPDFAGPEVHTAEYLARSLMEVRGRERPILNLPVFGKSAEAFRQGVHTNPDRAVGVGTWEEFLARG